MNQPVEAPPSSRFTWRIEKFSRLNTKKHYSEIFIAGGYKWRVLIFPTGNNVDYLSMYLDVADSGSLPYGWSIYAQFSLAVINQIRTKYSERKDIEHQFDAQESNCGFQSFMRLGELYDPNGGYLVNDTLIVEAEVIFRRGVDYWTYGSKKETGYVGLKNQGTTCYMNSLLQTLFHIPYFRKAVYNMPTTESDMPSGSIPLALQSLYYKLQYSDSSVATKKLTKSFGWDTYDSFMQHDVQELNRVLCEKLEDKMKGTVVEGTMQQLFEGRHMNYIECINVDYKSTRQESFYDLQLDVKGCRDVYASFDKYVDVERLEGDIKYYAEQYGLQDAKKGVLFIDFPPVLQLQLKRFEYDFMRDTMVKINDCYEFPQQLDLDRENGKYLSPEADRSVRNLYTLHSVLVHSGGVHCGHYYAFIRPTLSDQWYKFDDERVTKEDTKWALEEQYGGEEELPQTNPGFNNTPFKFTKYSNAYMLVYIRESDNDKIICNVDEKDIAEHVRERMKKEQEEKEHKKKEKAEAHLYTIIKVARDEDLVEQIGWDIYFDLVDHDKVMSFRIQKQIPFNLFKEEVAKEFGIPVQLQRFWLWAKRSNHTCRPNQLLTPLEETQTVGQLSEVSNKVHNAELKLFLEVERGLDLRPIAPPDKTKNDILLFFKLYDPEKEELRYVGRLFVKSTGEPMELLAKLNEMAGYSPDEEIELYEEIKFEPSVMCKPIEKRYTFRASQLEDGGIVCFQKSHTVESVEQYCYPDVPSFLDYVHNRQVVHFRSHEKPKEDDFCLEMSKFFTYDDVVERVAEQLNLDDPSKIRLTSHNCYSQQPKPQPIKYRGIDHLADMLIHYNQTSDILYYEVLDIPLPELQCLKTLKVAFHHAIKDEVSIRTIRLPKQSTLGDVVNDLKTKVALSHPDAELQLLEVFYHKIYKNLEGPEKETPAGKRGAEEATKSRSEVIMSLIRLGENFYRQVEQIGLQNILENPAAAIELSKRLCSPGIKDLRNDSSDELMASMPSEVSVVRDKVVLFAFLKMLESRMSNLSAEVALGSSKLAEAEAKLKSFESSEADLNSRVESLEAELIEKQAENEALKNQAIASEQKAEQKALFLEAELIRKEAENEVLKNQATASEQKASSFKQKALFLKLELMQKEAENEVLKNQTSASEQKASSSEQKALFFEAELIRKEDENEVLKNQASASEQKASSYEQKALFLETELSRKETENEVLKNQANASEQKASSSEQKALLLEAELSWKGAENEVLKNQASASEQQASTSEQKALFLEAELSREEAENEVLKNQATASEQKALSSEQKALFLEAEVIQKEVENEVLKNQVTALEQKASSFEQKASFLEAELIQKEAENEVLKNQASASEQKASSSEQKALFLKAELSRKEAENEVLKNQAIASEQKASSFREKTLFLDAEMIRKEAENEVLKNQATASEQKASSSEHKALFLEAELIRKKAENEVLKNQATASEQKSLSSEQMALFLEAELSRKEAQNEVLKHQVCASEQKASNSEQKALFLVQTILKRDKYSKQLSDAASKLIEDSSGSKVQGSNLLLFPSSS